VTHGGSIEGGSQPPRRRRVQKNETKEVAMVNRLGAGAAAVALGWLSTGCGPDVEPLDRVKADIQATVNLAPNLRFSELHAAAEDSCEATPEGPEDWNTYGKTEAQGSAMASEVKVPGAQSFLAAAEAYWRPRANWVSRDPGLDGAANHVLVGVDNAGYKVTVGYDSNSEELSVWAGYPCERNS
jgi:hypothetical protein